MKTLLEPNNVWILSQHRLKVAQTNLIPAICFYSGAFIPIHAGHLNVLQEAKQYIDNLGTHELLGAYICPAHSDYVADKLRPEEVLRTEHRLDMIYLAIENLDWVMVDLLEMLQLCETPLIDTMKGFISRVRSQLPKGSQMDVFWLKGEDKLFNNKSSERQIQLGFQPLYVINRTCNDSLISKNNESKSTEDYHEKQWQQMRASSSFPDRFHLTQATHINFSSTTIRACARNPFVTHEQLQLCTQIDSVTNYIIQHHLWSTVVDPLSTKISVIPVVPNKIVDLTSELQAVPYTCEGNCCQNTS